MDYSQPAKVTQEKCINNPDPRATGRTDRFQKYLARITAAELAKLDGMAFQ